MFEKIIPEYVDPFRFAERALSLEGSMKVSSMDRLCSNLKSTAETVAVVLKFGVDEQKISFLKGSLKTKLLLQCQRCMEDFFYKIEADFTLGIVNTLEEANKLLSVYEPALTRERRLALKELIEDEIILNLPIIPRHEPDECEIKLPLVDAEWNHAKGESPFQILKPLKEKQK